MLINYKYKLFNLIKFFRFLDIYNKIYAPVRSEVPNNPNKDENSIISCVFKRRHIEYIDEFKVYLSLPLVCENINPLEWWKINHSQFPTLSNMARDYLAIPATSVASEECFSLGKNLITDKRNCLAGKTIRNCMCLRSWWSGEIIAK